MDAMVLKAAENRRKFDRADPRHRFASLLKDETRRLQYFICDDVAQNAVDASTTPFQS